jgi:hypothetical protein
MTFFPNRLGGEANFPTHPSEVRRVCARGIYRTAEMEAEFKEYLKRLKASLNPKR